MGYWIIDYPTKAHRWVNFPGGPIGKTEYMVPADEDGFIEWDGGECPLPADQPCEAKMRNGDQGGCNHPQKLRWEHFKTGYDIVAYRPLGRESRVETAEEFASRTKSQCRNDAIVKGGVAATLGFSRITSGIEQALNDPYHPYHDLADVLEQAFQQAAGGKGKERHANDLPFSEQRMQSIAQGQGHIGGMIYQICKKAQEAERLERDAALRELLGAIVYAGGAFIYLKGDNDHG